MASDCFLVLSTLGNVLSASVLEIELDSEFSRGKELSDELFGWGWVRESLTGFFSSTFHFGCFSLFSPKLSFLTISFINQLLKLCVNLLAPLNILLIFFILLSLCPQSRGFSPLLNAYAFSNNLLISFTFETSHFDIFLLKDFDSENIWLILVTFDRSQSDISWLNKSVDLNIPCIFLALLSFEFQFKGLFLLLNFLARSNIFLKFFTFETSQLEISWSNDLVSPNIPSIFVTLEVFHLDIFSLFIQIVL
ncbi:hypothetical protein MMS_A0886 [Mycoplasma mycoides subsp. mycoides SC str. Gladysdale]|nr:hypothetical protein MMS_A0886 [Mycoplasma mycoides subsp. mycoides SC str. Gladysdale]